MILDVVPHPAEYQGLRNMHGILCEVPVAAFSSGIMQICERWLWWWVLCKCSFPGLAPWAQIFKQVWTVLEWFNQSSKDRMSLSVICLFMWLLAHAVHPFLYLSDEMGYPERRTNLYASDIYRKPIAMSSLMLWFYIPERNWWMNTVKRHWMIFLVT